MQGLIVKIHERGFGFIRVDNRPDLFFHRADLATWLEFGDGLLRQRVEFEEVEGDRGPKAINVRPAQ